MNDPNQVLIQKLTDRTNKKISFVQNNNNNNKLDASSNNDTSILRGGLPTEEKEKEKEKDKDKDKDKKEEPHEQKQHETLSNLTNKMNSPESPTKQYLKVNISPESTQLRKKTTEIKADSPIKKKISEMNSSLISNTNTNNSNTNASNNGLVINVIHIKGSEVSNVSSFC